MELISTVVMAAMDLLAFVITVWPFCSHLFMGVELLTVFLVLWSSDFLMYLWDVGQPV